MHHLRNALSRPRNALSPAALAASLILVSLLVAAPAGAQERDEDRLATLELQIAHDEAAAERWWWSWIGINAGFAVGEGIWAALTDDPGIRVEQLTGCVSAVVGVAMLLIIAPPALSGPNELAEHAGDPPEGRRQRAEAILRRSAEGQHDAHSVLSHVLVFAFAVATGAFLWLGYDRPVGAAVQAGGVIAIGELQILTHPTGAIDFLGG